MVQGQPCVPDLLAQDDFDVLRAVRTTKTNTFVERRNQRT